MEPEGLQQEQQGDNEQIRSRPFPRDQEAMHKFPACVCVYEH